MGPVQLITCYQLSSVYFQLYKISAWATSLQISFNLLQAYKIIIVFHLIHGNSNKLFLRILSKIKKLLRLYFLFNFHLLNAFMSVVSQSK